MKKLLTTAAFAVLSSILSFAQLPLEGTWCMSQTFFGTTVADYMIFENNTGGKVTNKLVINMKMTVAGAKVTGDAEIALEGTFTAEGDKVTIKWDQDTRKVTQKPMEVNYKGEKIDEDFSDCDEIFTELIQETEEEIKTADVDEFYNVKVKNDKLFMTSKDEKGKAETDKFTRVK